MGSLSPNAKQQFFTNAGLPASNCQLFTYTTGSSSTPLATYTDKATTVANPNPITLDARGEAIMYLLPQSYRYVLKDSLGSTIWTRDNVSPPVDSGDLAGTGTNQGASLVGYLRGDGTTATLQAVVKERLAGDRTFYVRTDGNDNNNGLTNSPSGAFKTIQHACDVISSTIDLNGHNVNVLVADGSYTIGASQSSPFTGEGQVYFIGNQASPASCVVTTANTACFLAEKGATYFLAGFKVVNTAGEGVLAQTGGFIQCGAMEFGSCANSQVTAGSSGTIYLSANYTITAGSACSSHLHVGSPGMIFTGVITATVGAGCTYSAYFIGVAQGTVVVKDCTFSSTAVTGPQYLAHKGGIIDAHPAFPALPGSIQGRQATGGVYRASQSNPFQIAPDIPAASSVHIQSYNVSTAAFTDRIVVDSQNGGADAGYIYINGAGSYAGANGPTVSGSGGTPFNIGTPTAVNFAVNTTDGYTFGQGFAAICSMTSRSLFEVRRQGTDGAIMNFWKGGVTPTLVGAISVTTTATTYATSSDYRLKENEVPIADGLDRVMQLKPYRLNFKVEPGEIIDSFFAHEVQAVVPNAVRGTKDGMGINEETGEAEPRYQTVDHSKMIPLLVAAIQDLKRDFDAYRQAHL